MRSVGTGSHSAGGRATRVGAVLVAAVIAVAGLAACGGDDDASSTSPSPAPATEAAPAATTEPDAPRPEPEPEPEERTLLQCLRGAPGVEGVLEKGGESEDATYFEELTGERPRIFAIALEGGSAEIDAFVFSDAAAAKKAAPGAGGAGQSVTVDGKAVLVGPRSADTAPIARCL